MAFFTDMPRLLFLLVAVALCTRAQSQEIDSALPPDIDLPLPPTPLPIMFSGAMDSCPLVVPPEDCPKLALANKYRATVDDDSIKFETKFGYSGKGSTECKQATVVIDSPPAGFKVQAARFRCQRTTECKAVKTCIAEDGKIVATANNVRGLSFRVKFVNKVRITSGIVTGTMYTSCGEAIRLKWDFASVNTEPDPFGPEPRAPAPLPSEPETPTPMPEAPTIMTAPEPAASPDDSIDSFPEEEAESPSPPEVPSPADGLDSEEEDPLPPAEAQLPVEGEDEAASPLPPEIPSPADDITSEEDPLSPVEAQSPVEGEDEAESPLPPEIPSPADDIASEEDPLPPAEAQSPVEGEDEAESPLPPEIPSIADDTTPEDPLPPAEAQLPVEGEDDSFPAEGPVPGY